MKVIVKTPNGGQTFDTKLGVLPYIKDLLQMNTSEINIKLKREKGKVYK